MSLKYSSTTLEKGQDGVNDDIRRFTIMEDETGGLNYKQLKIKGTLHICQEISGMRLSIGLDGRIIYNGFWSNKVWKC
jgi:hypothetical protein